MVRSSSIIYIFNTYVFLYLALALGEGAAPSKTDIISMLPGLIIIVAAIYALNYFSINILYQNIMFSSLSVALSLAIIIPLAAVTVVVAILKLIAVVKSP